MVLHRVYIEDYKNIKDFHWRNNEGISICVFVGQNGAGKSNFFEALLLILKHVLNPERYPISFKYEFEYSINDTRYLIKYDGRFKCYADGQLAKEAIAKPDKVIMYYSGHNDSISDFFSDYDHLHKNKIKTASTIEKELYCIDKSYKGLMMMLVLLRPDEDSLRRLVDEKLGIDALGDEIKLVLKRPDYARRKGFEIDPYVGSTKFWQVEGVLKGFLEELDQLKRIDQDVVREEGYSSGDGYDDEYIFYFAKESFVEFAISKGMYVLFTLFDSMKSIEMLGEFSIDVVYEHGAMSTTSQFSDGQFQSIYILAITELFKGKNCITILDEPDSFLHPYWQQKFFEQINQIMELASSKNQIMMASHSAITLVEYISKKINYFELKDSNANCYEVPKRIAIEKMSSNLLCYSEEEQLLSILNRIELEKKAVLLTEGPTDAKIIKVAWEKLYDDEMPFIPIAAYSCDYLYRLLDEDKVIEEMDGGTLFGLFDFDRAYNKWDGLRGEIIVNDPDEGLIKKLSGKEVFPMMLPVTMNETIRKQVIKDSGTKETFKDLSKYEIEHIFYGSSITEGFFVEEDSVGDGKIIKIGSNSKKVNFADKIVPQIESAYFEVFKPMFEFIKSKTM